MRGIVSLITGFLVALAVVAATTAQDDKRISTGKQMYQSYCANCHGASGTGDGVLAKSLRKRPPDLTQLAKDAGGTFPAEKVFKSIEGNGRPVSSDMPVWHDVFAKMQDNRGPDEIKDTIRALVDYLESIQAKP